MSDTWLHEYICLAFRIHKVVQVAYDCPFVEAYYGPPELQRQVEAEPDPVAAELVPQTISLSKSLSAQGFPPNRAIYLRKHLKGMETLCRKLSGETLSFDEEVKGCLDIYPIWTPEERFKQGHALYDSILPGRGNLRERLETYRRFLAFPSSQTDALIELTERAFAVARARTSAMFELPEGEMIDVQYFAARDYPAAARYRGNYQTLIEMNLSATGDYLPRLFDHKVCHEAYPGHHTEYVLKEQQLARKQGYLEQMIVLTLCPQCVITEGIAMVAHEMVFAPGEAEQWIVEHVYRGFHKDIDATVLLKMRQASEMLEGVWHNVAIMLAEGRSAEEVIAYYSRYKLAGEATAASMIAFVKHPIWGRNNLTYQAGQKLFRKWLRGPDRVANFRRFLTEQFVPSQLEGRRLPAPD